MTLEKEPITQMTKRKELPETITMMAVTKEKPEPGFTYKKKQLSTLLEDNEVLIKVLLTFAVLKDKNRQKGYD